MKVSIKLQRIFGTLSGMRSRISVSFKCIFLGKRLSLIFFLQKDNIIFVTFIHIYRKYHVSRYFLRKIIFDFPLKEKISYSPEKSNIFPEIQKDQIPVQFFWKDHVFGAFEENIIFPCIF